MPKLLILAVDVICCFGPHLLAASYAACLSIGGALQAVARLFASLGNLRNLFLNLNDSERHSSVQFIWTKQRFDWRCPAYVIFRSMCKVLSEVKSFRMAGETTGVVLISHRDVFPEVRGPALSRLWRLGYVATLIEKHEPVWVVSSAGYAAGQSPRQLVLGRLKPGRPAIEALVVAAIGLFEFPKDISDQAAFENVLHEREGVRYVASNYQSHGTDDDEDGDETLFQPSSELIRKCVNLASGQMRLGVVAPPETTLVEQGSVTWLRAEGFDVDEFRYQPL